MRRARLDCGLTQRELAERAKVGLRTLSNLEAWRHATRNPVKRRLLRALGIPFSRHREFFPPTGSVEKPTSRIALLAGRLSECGSLEGFYVSSASQLLGATLDGYRIVGTFWNRDDAPEVFRIARRAADRGAARARERALDTSPPEERDSPR